MGYENFRRLVSGSIKTVIPVRVKLIEPPIPESCILTYWGSENFSHFSQNQGRHLTFARYYDEENLGKNEHKLHIHQWQSTAAHWKLERKGGKGEVFSLRFSKRGEIG
jgi:hypothetical protein